MTGEYVALFFALTVTGETILVPVLCLALTGRYDLTTLALVTLGSANVSATAWYWVGRCLSWERLEKLPVLGARWTRHLRACAGLFERHGLRLVFLSRILYGMRVVAKVCAGASRLHYGKFVVATSLGVAMWFLLLLLGCMGVKAGFVALNIDITESKPWICAFVLLAFLAQWGIKKLLGRLRIFSADPV